MEEGSTDKRHLARTLVVQRLFERSFKDSDISKSKANEFSNKDLSEIDEDAGVLKYDKQLADKLLKIDYSNLAGWKTQDEVQGVVRELLEMDDEKEKKQVDLTPRPLRIKFGI